MTGNLTGRKNGFPFIFLGAALLTTSAFLIAFSAEMAFAYSLVCLLPLFYTLCLILIFILNPNIRANRPAVLILFLYAVRMVVFPFFLNVNGGYSGDRIESGVFSNMDPAVLVQCYEFLVVALVIGFIRPEDRPGQIGSVLLKDGGRTKRVGHVMLALTVVFGLITVLYPSLLGIFHPAVMGAGDYVKWQISNEQIKSNVPLIVYHLSTWAIPLLKIIWVYYGIILVKKRVRKEGQAFWLSILMISTLILVTTDDKAGGTFAALAMILLLFKLYPGRRKLSVGIMAVIIAVFLLTFIILPFRNKGSDFADYIGYKLNAYFSGTVNIAASLAMPRHGLPAYFAGDVLRSIPLAQGFFTNMPMSYLLFNQSLGYDTVYNSQILPCVGQSCFYFGYAGAPVFPAILVLLAMRCYSKAKAAGDSFGYFIYYYLTIFFSAGVVLYDFFLTCYLVLQYCLPFFVIYKLFLAKSADERPPGLRGAHPYARGFGAGGRI